MMKSMKIIIIVFCAIAALSPVFGCNQSPSSSAKNSTAQPLPAQKAGPVYSEKDIPKFTLVAANESTYALVVPKETTGEQLEALVFNLRDARKGGYLSRLIPPMAKAEKSGDYTVRVYVFTEKAWAAGPKVGKYMNGRPSNKADEEFAREFCTHIRANYFYTALPIKKNETGCAGAFEYDEKASRERCSKELF